MTLFLLRGATLPDPQRVMRGSGKVVRQVRLVSPADLDRPALRDLMDAELARCEIPLGAKRRLIIKSISPVQRPRRPASPLKRRKDSTSIVEVQRGTRIVTSELSKTICTCTIWLATAMMSDFRRLQDER